ncbi:diacylglycerol kinase family lipid kinase, partial [Aquimarina celericrescens]|nr:diacylglycerol kinase family lipid kinase [Aquimarina celericrescens]
ELNKQEEVKISIDNKNTFINPFMIFVSNSNELGYKISLTPKASLRDGLLDVIIIPKISKIKVVVFGVLMHFRKHQILKKAQVFQTKSIHLLRVKGSVFETQIDGELYQIKEKHIFI